MGKPKLSAQQGEFYEIERLAGRGRLFRSIAEVSEYLDNLFAEEWFNEIWGDFSGCTVARRSSSAKWSCALWSEDKICLADLNQITVLHELAHLLCPEEEGHSVLFAETMLTLLYHQMGFAGWCDFFQGLRHSEHFRSVREAGVQ